jgi:hypothetical protein
MLGGEPVQSVFQCSGLEHGEPVHSVLSVLKVDTGIFFSTQVSHTSFSLSLFLSVHVCAYAGAGAPVTRSVEESSIALWAMAVSLLAARLSKASCMTQGLWVHSPDLDQTEAVVGSSGAQRRTIRTQGCMC